ncbi:hypothetical protein SUGI_0659220 [Cryptomeria japonica]|nr:hypothetical protein SUGI_0659220 [Cryptomeria japonica]
MEVVHGLCDTICVQSSRKLWETMKGFSNLHQRSLPWQFFRKISLSGVLAVFCANAIASEVFLFMAFINMYVGDLDS